MNVLLKAALAFVLIAPVAVTAAGEDTDIEYRSVREALEDLRKQPGANLTIQGEWRVVSNSLDTRKLLWSFTRPTHYAYPSVARREVVEEGGVPYIQTSLLCEAFQDACDQLFIDFQSLDKSLSQRMQEEAATDSTTTE